MLAKINGCENLIFVLLLIINEISKRNVKIYCHKNDIAWAECKNLIQINYKLKFIRNKLHTVDKAQLLSLIAMKISQVRETFKVAVHTQ